MTTIACEAIGKRRRKEELSREVKIALIEHNV